MPTSRLCALIACISLPAFALTGCGGNEPKATHTTAPQTPTATPVPSYDSKDVKSSLLSAKDLHFKASPQSPNFPGPDKGAAPACSLTRIALPGKPVKFAQQFGSAASRFTDPNFNQLAAVYPNAAEATAAFATIKKKLDSCPAKHHIPAKRIPGNRITLAHDDTWKLSKDSISGWSHLRGFEKHVEPPSTSVINVYYLIYDYALRGNVVIASVYWQRVKPKKSGDPIAKSATELLTEQLEKFG